MKINQEINNSVFLVLHDNYLIIIKCKNIHFERSNMIKQPQIIESWVKGTSNCCVLADVLF